MKTGSRSGSHATGRPATPLSLANRGKVRIQKILGGSEMQRRLNDMGLVPGTEVEIVSNDGGGPLIVSVYDSRLMLGSGMASKIWVE